MSSLKIARNYEFFRSLFSRAVSAAKLTWALAPEGRFSLISPVAPTFSAAY
jgi:hypothetical protein